MGAVDNKLIFFRNDDVAVLDENLKRLIDIFISHEIPIHLAVIPNKLTKECGRYLESKIKKHPHLIEIGQHGFDHKNHSGSNRKFRKYEFGRKRSYAQQSRDIAVGDKIITEQFGQTSRVFTPPWHRFDRNTVRALHTQKFAAMSLGRAAKKYPHADKIDAISMIIDFNKKNVDGTWFAENASDIMRMVLMSRKSMLGILLHHVVFNGQREFRQLDRFLAALKKNTQIGFIRLSESILTNEPQSGLSYEALAYYLNYQFVPKPFVLRPDFRNEAHKDFDFRFQSVPRLFSKNETKISCDLYHCLKESVLKFLPDNEEPVGLLLSGGLDSAALLHVLREITDRKIYTLTGAYDVNDVHLLAARRLVKKYHTIHQDFIISPDSLVKLDDVYSGPIPQPIGDSGFLSSYLMIKKLTEHTTHVFSGDGADCLFCGLKIHKQNLAMIKQRAAPYEHYRFGEVFLDNGEWADVFSKKAFRADLEFPLRNITARIRTRDPIKRQILIDLNFLVKNRVDYIYYAAQVNKAQICLPYLRKVFIHFALKIPSHYVVTESFQQKYILRKAFENKLPQWVMNIGKEGFTPPFKLWYYSNKEFVVKRLIKTNKIGISNNYIKYLINNIKRSHCYDIGMRIWLLLNLASWYDGMPGNKIKR